MNHETFSENVYISHSVWDLADAYVSRDSSSLARDSNVYPFILAEILAEHVSWTFSLNVSIPTQSLNVSIPTQSLNVSIPTQNLNVSILTECPMTHRQWLQNSLFSTPTFGYSVSLLIECLDSQCLNSRWTSQFSLNVSCIIIHESFIKK